MFDLTICVVNYNTRELLSNCLTSIFQKVKGVDFQVVVVDNASSDGSREMLQSKFPQVKVIANTENAGFTRANNQAIAASQSRYVLLLNSDTIVVSDVLSEMKSFLDAHPEAAAVSCRLLRADGSIQPYSYRRPTLSLLLFQILGLKRLLPSSEAGRKRLARLSGGNVRSYLGDAGITVPIEAEVVSGACLFFRREVLERVGPFDENIFFGPDDQDFCLRLRKAGWKIFVLPTAGGMHLVGQSAQKQWGPVSPAYYRGVFYFYIKRYGWRAKIFLRTVVPTVFWAKSLPPVFTLPFSKDRASRRQLIAAYLKIAGLALKA